MRGWKSAGESVCSGLQGYRPGDLLEDEKDEDEKRISIRLEGGLMPLHVV
jgi:hypothetical protein